MWILRIVGMVLLTILTSFYFFPFEFTFLPSINTKMIMAGIGLVLLIIQLARQQKSIINRDFFQLSLIAGIVSLIGFFAVTWNDTYDYTYATYIVSMWVWLSGAYVVIQAIKRVHGHVSVELVCNYLIVVCVAQCLIAFAMTQYPPLKNFVDSFLGSTGFMGKMKDRMYGIGASLDVAGSRFSVILVMIISILLKIAATDKKKYIGLYFGAFFVIAVIGNMMSRTTTVGVIIALAYLFYASRIYTFRMDLGMGWIWGWFVGILCAVILLVTYGYYTNPEFQANLRFGFEGFFSLVEKGRWEVHSNEMLQNMYVFPDNLKTWFIGDGYFDNPYGSDPYYTGPKMGGFYKGTDVGYLRFIFYFGLMGLVAFSLFMCKVAKVCMNRFTSYRSLFFMILLLNFAVWFKVSTDVFLVFALFLCISKEENQIAEQKSLSDQLIS
mgnify:CR=1 FL=1